MKTPIVAGAVLVGILGARSYAEVPWPTLSRVPQSVTGPRLTLDPWADESWAQMDSVLTVGERGHLKGGPANPFAPPGTNPGTVAQHVVFTDNWGRARISPESQTPVLGLRYAAADFGVHHAGFPSQLQDISVATGSNTFVGLGVASLIVGAGYSGDAPFNGGDAWYGIAHFIEAFSFNKDEQWLCSIDYNGNNAFMPDVPLPGFAFSKRVERLQFWLGFPETSVIWRPVDCFTLEAGWGVPETIGVRATCEIGSGLSAYGAFDNFFDAFHFSTEKGDSRLFFQQRRVELGVRYTWGKWIDLALGGGYAWDQELFRGFDARSLHDFASFSDGPYLSVRLGGSF